MGAAQWPHALVWPGRGCIGASPTVGFAAGLARPKKGQRGRLPATSYRQVVGGQTQTIVPAVALYNAELPCKFPAKKLAREFGGYS